MKKLYVLLFMLSMIHAHAQVSDAWITEIESIFQHVNRTPVTTGLLTDYGLYFTNIDKFNGIPSDTNYIELSEWQMLYTSLYTCRFNSNAASMPVPATVFAFVDSISAAPMAVQQLNAMLPPVDYGNKILFAGLHYHYEQFKSNAVPSLVYVSGNKIYDTPNRPATPYEIKEAFAVVPTRTALEGASHTFLFSPQLFYTNTGKTISTVNIDFGDGAGYRNVSANEPIPIVYDAAGVKTLRVKITYTDSSVKESRTKINVTNIPDSLPMQARYGGVNIDTLDFPLAGFHPPKAYNNKVAGARVTVEYSEPGIQVIRKPLIIVEGFDPWKIMNPDDPDKNTSFEDFISTEYLGQNIEYTYGTKYYETLSDALQGEGYDLIFVDFDDGTDYIQRNAYLVENIIEWVNSVKQPYNGVMQKNVVMGASMGGLVARYALRDMELSNPVIDHDTRLYASFDTPHQGANLPIAFQAMVSHLAAQGIGVRLGGIQYNPSDWQLGTMVPKLGSSFRLLNSPAARQMLYYSVVGIGNTILTDNSIHNAFMADYTAKGYPQLNGIRNIVLASGSECGTNQGYEPHAEFINYNGGVKLSSLVNFLGNVFSSFSIHTNHPLVAAGAGYTTRTDIKFNFVLNALPNQSAKRVYLGKAYIKKKILWVINVNITIFDKSFNAPASYLPLDNASGGVQDFSKYLEDEEGESTLPFELTQSRFNFVPTFSSLDIGGGLQPITLADITRAYSPAYPPAAPKNVKAANFFANPTEGAVSNEVHVQVTLRNG